MIRAVTQFLFSRYNLIWETATSSLASTRWGHDQIGMSDTQFTNGRSFLNGRLRLQGNPAILQKFVMISFLHVVNKEGFILLLKQFKRLDPVTYGAKRRVRAWDKEKVWRSLRTYLPFYRQLLQHNGLSGLIYSKQATFSFKLSFSIVNRDLKKVQNWIQLIPPKTNLICVLGKIS